jgi:glycosyltransferase involved in cell wall biosynthesis
MRLAFDVTYLLSPRTGIGTVASAVLERLGRRSELDVVGYTLAGRSGRRVIPDLPPGVKFSHLSMAAPPSWVRAAWKRVPFPPAELFCGAADVVYGPNYLVPPTLRASTVVTAQDITFMRHPEWATADVVRSYPPMLRRAIRRGAIVHTASHHVAGELIDAFDLTADRVVVVPNATDPLPDADPLRGHQLAGGPRYVVALGTVEPRKNLPRLVAAWSLLADDDPDVRLVIAGPDGWGLSGYEGAVTAARHAERIVRLGWVDDADRSALLRGATALAYPSLDEGFGLVALEAMSVGTPVVAGRAGSLPEVCGDAAVLVDPTDVEAIADGLQAALTDDELRSTLVPRGHRRVARYSWDRTADGMVDLFRSALDTR